MDKPTAWLPGAVIYQIYPRSFKDAGDSGIGNLQGIISKLDYLKGKPDSLDVTAIWLSPIYTSPMADFGYDVADYIGIDPIFGTIDDFKQLVSEAHARSLKIIIDFVPNHSSSEHPWFIESKSSCDNPKRDWYIWADPKEDGQPPNNWLSVFGGSAWELSPETGQYYLHSFLAEQPDLNWDNPEVRQAMHDAMRFWLDLGVDGFRVDAVDWLSKDPKRRDDPANPDPGTEQAGYDHGSLLHTYSRDGPQLFDRLNEMAQVLVEYDDRFMVTEGHPETSDVVAGYQHYYQGVDPRYSSPFNFQCIYLPWQAGVFRDYVSRFQTMIQPEYIPVYALGNHDESRLASRIGSDAVRGAALMLLTLPGMAFIYNGDEIGMTDGSVPPGHAQDPFAGDGKNRDPERTPMQWDDSPQAGFTAGDTPWLPLNDNYHELNVAAQSKDEESLLQLYKRLINYRAQSAILKYGDYQTLDAGEQIFCYRRMFEGQQLVVLLNMSNDDQPVNLDNLNGGIELSTNPYRQQATIEEPLTMWPNEGLIIRMSNN